MLARILPRIGGHRAVVVSDYDKGVVTPELAAAVIGRCAELGVPCVVDPKKVDFSIFSGATVLAPNLFEAARALGRPLATEAEIERGAEGLRVGLGLAAMLITRGPDGMTLSTPEGNHHTPARTRAVADVTGAGDTVTAVLAACLGAGWDAVEACRLASVAAGIAVGQPGTYVVQAEELEAAWRGASPKVVDRPLAVRRVAEARRAGRRIVFTERLLRHPPRRAPRVARRGEGARRLPGRRAELRQLGQGAQGRLQADRPGGATGPGSWAAWPAWTWWSSSPSRPPPT